ncbi:MAG: c-type cytochrome [Steroidobacteraceae bacterium]
MQRSSVSLLVLLALAAASPVMADGSAEAGAAKAATCVACHGLNGNSVNPDWPNLAGQNASYIREQLHLFRGGQRYEPNMAPQAAALSDQDIDDLAAYYSALAPQGLEADPSYWKAGEQLYRSGNPGKGVPACVACHGPVGRGNPGAGYPALRAQYAVYTVKQLRAYAANARYVDQNGESHQSRNGAMMNTIAAAMTAEDIRDVASYIQGMR